ncbi:ABC transporter [Eggerthella sp. 1_3_56FAA]|nr:ABC transporter [Eggerthella sp. 1_3_56FAA]
MHQEPGLLLRRVRGHRGKRHPVRAAFGRRAVPAGLPFGRRLPVLHDHEHGVPVQPPEPAHVRHDVQPDHERHGAHTGHHGPARGFRRHARARSGETARGGVRSRHVRLRRRRDQRAHRRQPRSARRQPDRVRGPLGRRQDDRSPAHPQVLGNAPRRGAHRRACPVRTAHRQPHGSGVLRVPRSLHARRHPVREHQARPTERHARAGGGRRAGRADPRHDRGPAERLRHVAGRERRQAVRRRAAARVHRSRHLEGCAHHRVRRSHQLHRHRERAPDPACALAPADEQDLHHDRPPPAHHRACGPDMRVRPRPPARTRNARFPDQARRRLRPHVGRLHAPHGEEGVAGMITLIKTVRTVAGDKAKTLVLPIALSCADSLLHMGMFAVMIAAIINLVAGAFNAELLAFYSGALVVLFVVRAALYATNYAQTQFRGADITADLRLSIGNHLRRLNLGYFDKNSIGQLASVLTTDVSDFEQTITTSLASFFKVVCFSVLACAFAFAINWLYGLIILAIVVASLPLARLGGRAASKGGVRYRESVHAVISRIIEYINGIKTFKLYNLTGRRFERLDRSFADLKRESIRMELSIMPFSVLFSVATSLIVPLGLVAGTLMFMDGQLDAPRLIAAVMIAVSISSMMTTLGVIYPELNYLAKAAEGIERIQAERPLAYRDGNPRFTSFDVRFDDVRFGYADGKEVLHGVTFTAQPGTRTALVGPSGSGKTTVISLISRFWDASSGSVRVGGHEVRDIAPDALAEQVAVVFQDVYLLADTVANNIRVGKPDATQEEVEAAARAAHCHDFIEALPQGYDTLVGEGGSTLSGGEKQRISIARALIKNAPIVLLDESTSSLDADNEHEINRALDVLMADKTVIVIAHRLDTVERADQILVLDDGRVRERGTHDELLAQGGWYAHAIAEQEKARSWTA